MYFNEGHEVKPGSAGRLTGFMHFAFGDQRLAVGSPPAGRRWRIRETIIYLTDKITHSSTKKSRAGKPSGGFFKLKETVNRRKSSPDRKLNELAGRLTFWCEKCL